MHVSFLFKFVAQRLIVIKSDVCIYFLFLYENNVGSRKKNESRLLHLHV